MVISPYLGVPNSWHTFLAVVAGLGLMVLGFLLRGEALGRTSGKEPRGRHTFVENSTATIVQDYSAGEHTE